jgi:ABC-type hemin transport system substrate-binding protein
MRQRCLWFFFCVVLLATTDVLAASSWNEGLGASAPRRIVSLVPAVTEMCYAIGAGEQAAANLPPALTMGMGALLNGICAGAHE